MYYLYKLYKDEYITEYQQIITNTIFNIQIKKYILYYTSLFTYKEHKKD